MEVSVVIPSNRDRVITTDSVPDYVEDVQIRRDDGLNRARNTGIENAVHQTVVILDDDLQFDAKWFERLVEQVVRTSGTVFAARGTGILPTLTWPEGFTPGMGRVMAFDRTIWRATGGFPVPCSHGGDTDFLMSAYEAGFRVEGIDHEWSHLDDDVDVYGFFGNVKWLWFLARRHPRLVLPRLPQLTSQKIRGAR